MSTVISACRLCGGALARTSTMFTEKSTLATMLITLPYTASLTSASTYAGVAAEVGHYDSHLLLPDS